MSFCWFYCSKRMVELGSVFWHSAQNKSSDKVLLRMFLRIDIFTLCFSNLASKYSSFITKESSVGCLLVCSGDLSYWPKLLRLVRSARFDKLSELSSSSTELPLTPLCLIIFLGSYLTWIFWFSSNDIQWFKISQSRLSTIFSSSI